MKTTETFNQEIAHKLNSISSTVSKKRLSKGVFAKSNRGKVVKYSIVAANALMLLVVVAVVMQPTNKSAQNSSAILSTQADEDAVANPTDVLSSADIAVNVARVTRIEEATSVANKADTVNAQLNTAPSDDIVAAQPQVIATSLKSRFDIQTYVVVKGDTIKSIAKQFDITTDTIRWSNDISDEDIKPGLDLLISPINGIVYKVKSGDTAASLASKYSSDKNKISIFNDFEVSGVPVGAYIVIPDGRPPSQAVVPAAAPTSTFGTNTGFAWGGGSAVYSGNGYDYGYCTWWAALRRSQTGSPIPSNLGNASTWTSLAQQAGFGVGSKPASGAVIWTPPRDYYGHVGYVEKVNSDGSVLVSEMNVMGWGVVSKKTLTKAQAAQYNYIY
ncbi:MAG TPA: LysM peptidoglycan-binding domain-containing protein [Candidatus Saccharibacteria bacterium]|nr:LysM peptidoglycan-binding domain-containing protein [Candidatus Saccharibacteria bacterium]